jgi:hypothetical protein
MSFVLGRDLLTFFCSMLHLSLTSLVNCEDEALTEVLLLYRQAALTILLKRGYRLLRNDRLT